MKQIKRNWSIYNDDFWFGFITGFCAGVGFALIVVFLIMR